VTASTSSITHAPAVTVAHPLLVPAGRWGGGSADAQRKNPPWHATDDRPVSRVSHELAISGQKGHCRPMLATTRDKVAAPGHNRPMTSSDDEPFLTETEAAEVIRVSARTLRRWRAKGTGPPVAGYAGRRALYRRSELLAWLTRERRQ
jgi:hypothetical protein